MGCTPTPWWGGVRGSPGESRNLYHCPVVTRTPRHRHCQPPPPSRREERPTLSHPRVSGGRASGGPGRPRLPGRSKVAASHLLPGPCRQRPAEEWVQMRCGATKLNTETSRCRSKSHPSPQTPGGSQTELKNAFSRFQHQMLEKTEMLDLRDQILKPPVTKNASSDRDHA